MRNVATGKVRNYLERKGKKQSVGSNLKTHKFKGNHKKDITKNSITKIIINFLKLGSMLKFKGETTPLFV